MTKFKRIIMHPYSITSEGCKKVAANLTTMEVDNLRVNSHGQYVPKDGDFIMGWGAGNEPSWLGAVKKADCKYINTSEQVCRSICKVAAFKQFKKEGVPTPKWTLEQEEALKWSKGGKWVCCRQVTEGMDGSGLILATKPSEMVYSPLFTQFVENTREYRVYVFDGDVIDVLEKVANDDVTNKYIRTESNHYIYTRPTTVPKLASLGKACKDAAEALGLTFAGVDVLVDGEGEIYVLETNTAPGIGQITAKRIADAMRKMAGL